MAGVTGPRLSVVMPSYRRPDLLATVVPAYLAQRPDELLVVLDGPQPESADLLAELGAALVPVTGPATVAGPGADGGAAAGPPPAGVLRVVELPANRGPAAARAAGVAAATGDVVLISDDDILPLPGMLARHRAFHRDRPRAVLAGYLPVELPRPGRGQVAARLYAADYERAARRWERAPARVLDGLWGGNVSLPRDLYLAAAAAATDAPAGYFEDMELGLRLRALGATGHFDRAAAGRHLYTKRDADLVAEAARRGAAARAMRQRWGGAVGLLYADDDPGWVRALRRLVAAASRLPAVVPAATACLWAVMRGCGMLRRWRAEELAARLLRGVVETDAYARPGGGTRGRARVGG